MNIMDVAYHKLTQSLRSGAVKGGALLSIPMLAEQFGLSLAPVRDAVKRAEALGLIEMLPKRGFMVMQGSPERVRECLQLRALFDAEGARNLIGLADTNGLTALRLAHEALRDAALEGDTRDIQLRAIETDLSLHDALAAALGSSLMAQLYEDNRNRIAIIQNQRPFLAARVVSAMNEHLAIIDAIEQRDGEMAAARIKFHLSKTLEWWGVERQAGV
jgi:DNA-binding GntR family transcriptional regulator